MTLSQWRALTRYLRSALWVVPFIAILVELALARVLHDLDPMPGWTLLGFGATGARAILEAIVTMTLSFLVFTFGSLLVAIQIAGGQLTPRIISTLLLRDNVVRYTVGLFVFSMMFAISALNRMEANVHQLVLFVAGCLAIASIAAFLYMDRLRGAPAAADQHSDPCRRERAFGHRASVSAADRDTGHGGHQPADTGHARPDHSARRGVARDPRRRA